MMSADAFNLAGADDTALVAEFVRRVPALAPDLRDQASAALAENTRSKLAGALADAGETANAAPEDPRLASLKAQYSHWPEAAQKRCPWAEVKERLLGNDGEDLKRAEAMPEGGILFGLDKQGNPLIANGGLGPILTDMNYADTRKAVLFSEKDGKTVPTGYEMLSEEAEIRAFETFTGKPVVQPPEGFVPSPQDNGWRGIWRDSGDNPAWARCAGVIPGRVRAYLFGYDPTFRYPWRGVRCLLRVLRKS